MKNQVITSCILILVVFLSSCSKKPVEMIVGEWKIADVQTTMEIPEEQKEAYEQIIVELKANSKLVINADNTFTRTDNGEESTGNWTLSEDAQKLSLSYGDGKEEVSTITELTDEKLSLSIEVNNATNTIVYEKQAKE